MNRQTLTLVAALGCGVCLYFIGGESNQYVVATPESNSESNTEGEQSIAAVTSESLNAEDESGADEQTVAQETNSEALKIAFELPFPDRLHLFQAPKRQGKGRTKSNGQVESSVELVGFVNVFEPQVSLSINGLVTMIAEGGKQKGIEVISIQPPTVVLQRGRQRWQASLDN